SVQPDCIRSRSEGKEYDMNENLHLINCVANDLNCEYLSDLHAPHLLNSIKKIIGNYVAEDFTLKDWQDTVNYILDSNQIFESCEEAKQFLLHY
ncbi:MAG: hypothetical protein ACLRVU_11450, partial [Beduini sp.]|uniref:hypothetical protein n=2 Tax=Beduini sp. TaxID=1922300 RepID=UPI00399F1DFB